MALIEEYFDLVAACNTVEAQPNGVARGWRVQKWEMASLLGNGFRGGVFESESEIIVGFSGTGGGSAAGSQWTADIRIGAQVIPNMAGGAQDMVSWAKTLSGGRKPVSIAGHSLGGALAQVVGNWSGCPFIAFNGPGMKSHLKISAFNIFKPMQMIRSALAKNTDDTIGICFSVKGDPVATYGYHVGYEIVLNANVEGLRNKHIMNPGMFLGLSTGGYLKKTPRDILSIWPK